MRRGNTCCSIALACLAWLAAGCGESVDYPDTAPVKGTVTLDGKPLDGADIVLKPADPGQGQTYGARATSAADGTFAVNTFFSASHDLEGAVPGKYKIAVIKTGAPAAAAAAPTSHEQASSGPTGRDHAAVPKNVLPKKYGDPETSGLEFEVKADGENTLPLDLKSK